MSRVSVSQHAIDKAATEFRVDRRVAEDWVRSQFRRSTFISDIVSAEGNPCRLYGFQRTAIVVADSEDYIITVYQRNRAVPEMYARVNAVVQRELRRAQRNVKSVERRVAVGTAKLRVQIAQAEYNMTITPSQRVIDVNKARIDEYERGISKLNDELLRAKKEMTAVAKSVVAYV